MINLRRTFLYFVSRYYLESTSSFTYYRPIDKCRKFYGRISSPGWSYVQRFYTTSNYERNALKVIDSEIEDKSFIEKYFDKLGTKIRNFEKLSKADFQGILTVVGKEGCSQEQAVLLLQCCGDSLMILSPAEQSDITLSTWKILKKKGQVSIACYNALLLSLAKCNYRNKVINVRDVLIEIEKCGLIPNEETYVQLLHYACSIGDIDEAISIVNIMRDGGIPLNQTAFNFIVLGHGRAGNLLEAENVLKLMNNSFIKPSSETYTMLLKVAAENGERETFSSYLDGYRTLISDIQRLDIVESLSIGQLDDLIPEVLRGGSWKSDVALTNSIIDTCGKLLRIGKIDSAFLVFDNLSHYIEIISDPDNESTYGHFFIQEMIRSDVPLKKIIEICNKMHHRNSFALFKATEAALISNKHSLALQLLEALVEHGHNLRPHYFWPIFTSAGNRDGQSGVLEVLDAMLKLGVKPDCETIFEWISVHCNLLQPLELVRKFQDKKLPLSVVLTAVVQSLLFQGELKGAAAVCNKFKTNLEWSEEKFVKLLSTEYINTGDIKSVMEILKLVRDKNAGHDIINYLLTRRVPVDDKNLLQFVEVLKKSGFNVPKILEDAVDNIYNGKKFASNNLNARPYITHPRDMNVNELEHHLIELKSKKMNTRGVLRHLLQKHSQLGNIKRVLEVKKELEDSGAKFSAGMMASLLQTFVKAGLVQEAVKCLSDIQNNYPSFKLDQYKIIDVASLCIRSGHYERGVDILRKQERISAHTSFSKNCWRLLNAVAENYGPDKTVELLNLLLEKNYCVIDNNLLGPIIRSYLSREDFVGAVDIYEKYSLEYRCTPLQHELLCSLLTKESDEELTAEGNKRSSEENKFSALLKRVVDIGEKVHGRDSTNNAVIVALADCNLVKRLKKYVKESSKKVNTKLMDSCNRLADENKSEVLLRVIDAVKSSPYLKIEDFYNLLLKVYVRRNDCDGALALWTTLQDENVVISNEFLRDLALLLSSNKRNIPFVIPTDKTIVNR